MKKEVYSNKKIFLCLFLFFAIICCGFFTGPKQSVNAEGMNFQTPTISNSGSLYSYSTLTNNIVFIKFKGEQETYTLYGNSYDLFNQMFNDGTYSVQNYYNANSNGKLQLKSDIISSDKKNIKIYTLDKPRTYYMPYMYYNNNSKTYVTNQDGYFDYYVISGTQPVSDTNVLDMVNMYKNRTMLARVYTCDGAPEDSNISDKILSYNAAVTYASNNGCTVASSLERIIREYELLCNVVEKAKADMSVTNSDLNNDKYFDCFSVALIDNKEVSQYNIEWSTLLWAHQVDFSGFSSLKFFSLEQYKSNFISYGMKSTDIDIWLNYINNQPKTSNGLTFGNIYLSNYEMYNLTTKTLWDNMILDNTTACHELGHVLGLPDLYSYADNSSTAVGSWSHMCNSHTKYASFFTSYEREKLGWLNENNIKTLDYNGSYELNVVAGIDNSNVVAYKVNIPDTNEWIYFEYRNPDSNASGFDKRCGSKAGLLVYTVNKDVDGNSQCPPYEIYMQRQSGKSVYYATLGQNESLGNTNKNITSNAICYNMSSPKNTGIVVSVVDVNSSTLTFEIQSDILQDVEYQTYTVDDFGGNQEVYDKLLSQSVTTGVLNQISFVGKTILDVSSCHMTEMFQLSLFDFSTILYVDVSDNLLGSGNNYSWLTQTISFLQQTSVQKIYLAFNLINLNSIQSSMIAMNIFEWGIQFASKTDSYFNNSPSFTYYYNDTTDTSSILVNGVALEKCSSPYLQGSTLCANPKIYNVDIYGDISVVLKYADTCPVGAKQFTYTFKNYKVESKYTQQNQLVLIKGDTFPSFKLLITVSGFSDLSNLTMENSFPALSQSGEYSCSLQLKYNDITFSVTVYYKVVTVSVNYLTTETVYEIGEQYIEKYIEVFEDGVKLNYTLSSSGDSLTYYVTYYYGTVNPDGTFDSTTVAPELSTGVSRKYVASYSVFTSFGKKCLFNRQIVVSNDVIKPSSMDSTIYGKLLSILSKSKYDYIYKSDFKSYSYIDLSNILPSSLKGLELLDTSNLIIDLSSNNLNNIQEVNSLLTSNNKIKLILLLNKFSTLDASSVVDLSRSIFGVQNIITKIVSNSSKVKICDVFTDFSSNFEISMQGAIIENNSIMLSAKGQSLECVITSKIVSTNNKQYTFSVDYGYIALTQTEMTKEYSQSFVIDTTELFVMEGLTNKEIYDFNLKYNNKEIRTIFPILQNLGTNNVTFTLQSGDNIVEMTLQFTNQDTTAPVINFKGKQVVYVVSQSQYDTLYANDECVITDGYDGNLIPQVSELKLNSFGEYKVKYFASDSSNNYSEFVRTVHFGNVTLNNTGCTTQLNYQLVIPFNFMEFKELDFVITYDYNNNSRLQYNSEVGISLTTFGQSTIYLYLRHKENSEIMYNFEYYVNIVDEVKPKIVLKGDIDFEFYAGKEYVETGYTITDNSTSDILTEKNTSQNIHLRILYTFKGVDETNYKNVTSIDTSKIGTYKITYIASDNFDNVITKERYIHIVYAPIGNISIDETKLLTQYSQGKTVEFNTTTKTDYIVMPNPELVWYINDDMVGNSNGTFKYKFDTPGEYRVYATLADNSQVCSQVVTFTVYEKSPYENVFLYVGIGLGSMTVVGFGAFFIGVYRKRYFY